MASHGLPQANPYHYKAFRLKINRVGKYPTSWKLKKLPNTGVHALSSPCRTTSLLVLKKSNGWIFHDPREKEDVLSLKMKNKTYCIPFSFLPLHVCLSFLFYSLFLLFFSFSLFLSHLTFHFLLIFSSPYWSFSHLFGEIIIRSMGGNFLPSFLKPNVWLSFFLISFLISL